eukprot:5128094-Pleurochrysis_carterae.AAC.1
MAEKPVATCVKHANMQAHRQTVHSRDIAQERMRSQCTDTIAHCTTDQKMPDCGVYAHRSSNSTKKSSRGPLPPRDLTTP